MPEYTDEFFRLSIRSSRREEEEELASKYVNGLSYVIQDELALQTVDIMDRAYQLALKAEEKLA